MVNEKSILAGLIRFAIMNMSDDDVVRHFGDVGAKMGVPRAVCAVPALAHRHVARGWRSMHPRRSKDEMRACIVEQIRHGNDTIRKIADTLRVTEHYVRMLTWAMRADGLLWQSNAGQRPIRWAIVGNKAAEPIADETTTNAIAAE